MTQAFLIGLVSQSSLLLTALLVYRFTFGDKFVGQLAGLGAGALLGAASFQLAPEAMATLGGPEIGLWLLVGAAVFVIADRIIEKRFGEGGAMGIVVGNINDALPESLIFGIQLASGLVLNPTLAISVWVSNIPQALPPAAELRANGWPARKQVALWGSVVLLAGILSAVGFAAANALGDIGGARIAAFTIGGLIAMLTTSLIPFAYAKGGLAAGIWAVVGFGLTLAASWNTAASPRAEWWRTAVIYQVYPRSFADASGDGVGDLAGITSRLTHLKDLGVDAVWLSPFFRSPQRDGGYDVSDYCDVDPIFGTLDDFDHLLDRAHELDLRVIVDIVPNHSSSDHRWFQEALAAAPGSPVRERYIFREGRGPGGDAPPNNWSSVFGGPCWTRTANPDGTPGEWYLHLFDSTQPDFDWSNPWVHERFEEILRFWLDRGVDGFRIDVANGLVKAAGLPDWPPLPANATHDAPGDQSSSDQSPDDGVVAVMPNEHHDAPMWGQDGVHPIWRKWHALVKDYPGDRALVAEAWVEPLSKMALWVRDDELHQAFNFPYLLAPWEPGALRAVIDDTLDAFTAVGAPSTWVLSNHDTIRHTSRLALHEPPIHGVGIGPGSADKPDTDTGLRRGRAATLLMLALPGSAYIFQGEELGLPDVIELPDAARQDPTFHRTAGQRYGRDGCRVPIPWEADAPGFGFSPTGASWLPQPPEWADYAADAQLNVPGSTLEMYRRAVRLRSSLDLGSARLEWNDFATDALSFTVGKVLVIANFAERELPLPPGSLLLASGPVVDTLPCDTTAWLDVS